MPQGNMFSDVKLKPGDQETAYVVQVDDLENIYCQLKRHEDSLYECKLFSVVSFFISRCFSC